ncbi:MAG: leucine-rich repeat domain-containing protein [Ruminococcaceae bacterium]|nr:leucine-rich repeat domain-containing protein [Oscillospiraceae bacterium]
MRKFITFFVLLALVLSLAACGGKESEGSTVTEIPMDGSPGTAEPAPAATAAPEAPAADAAGIRWQVDGGTLTVSGQGAMSDYELFCAPWDESGESIAVETLVVEEGISYLGSHAFAACLNLSEVHLPQSLRGIGSFCFADCLALENVDFAPGLMFIGDSAFSGTGLRTLTLPEGLAAIGELSFTLCAALETVRLPDSLCSVGEGAFADCEALKSISMGSGAEAAALLEAAGLGELLSFSGTAISARDYPWSGEVEGCSWALQHGVLTLSGSAVPNFGTADGDRAPWAPMAALINEVRAADELRSLGDYAFWDCRELTAVKLPDSVSYIGAYAFGACEALAHFDFPAALDTIGIGAFSFCTALESVDLPEGLVHIDDDAFQMCTALQRIRIPASVTEIGSGALSFNGETEAEIVTPGGSYAEQWVKDNL